MRLKSLQIKKRETQSEKSRKESKIAPDLGDPAMETKSAAKINVYRPRAAAKFSKRNRISTRKVSGAEDRCTSMQQPSPKTKRLKDQGLF